METGLTRRERAHELVTNISGKKPISAQLERIETYPDPNNSLRLGEYKIDFDHSGKVRARFILGRLLSPFDRIFFLDEKVKGLFPNCELIKIKRSRCDDGSKWSWWVIKWDRERKVLKEELYGAAKKRKDSIIERF